MSNLTISVDADVLRRARARAVLNNTSVNAMLRQTLEDFASGGLDTPIISDILAQVNRLFPEPVVQSERGWTREEIHER